MSAPPTFDICAALPRPRTTTLLEASAGTGKTWTIAALVTRYVAEGRARLGEMLIVTFGRAASQELRERVRAQLTEAEQALDDVVAGLPPRRSDSLLELLLDVPADELVDRRDRVREALTDFDAATIATTHQFCQLVLRSLGVAGDSDSGARLVEDLDDLLVRGFARSDEEPVFDRRTALGIARKAVGDPQARLEPRQAPKGTPAARRLAFARAVRKEMDVRKRRLGVLSYDDLLSRLAQALADPDAPARDRMRARWQVVLVDEFQDTDPVQWQVLDRAFSGHATMVLIGDPKQAIYAFRGGDVVTYLDAERTASDKLTLGTSYRSDAPLLDAVQALLRGAALGDERIVVRDVRAAHPEPRLVGAPRPDPFRLRLVDRERFGVKGVKGVPVNELRTFVAADLAQDVKRLLGAGAMFCDRPLLAGDVAVLCETRKQCEIVRAGLVEAGVQAVIAGSGSVFATPAADEWLCLLEAIEQPHRSSRVRAAALTSFLGHTAADLDTAGERLTEEVAETLRDWAELLRSRGVAAVHETALTSRGLPARVLGELGGERMMTDLRHLAESLHDVAARERLGLAALLTWLRERMDQSRLDVTGERTRRLDSDAAAVQILTIHGSKGLQFPVVHLPFLADLWPRVPDFPLFHDDQGRRCLDVGGKDSDPDHQRRAVVEESGEELRLLYVAMTRAQSQLVAWWMPSAKNTETSSLHRMVFGRQPGDATVPGKVALPDDARARTVACQWSDVGGPVVESVEVPAARPVPSVTAPPTLAARSWTRAVDQLWRRTSYTALSSASTSAATSTAVMVGSEPENPPRDDEPDAAVRVLSDSGAIAGQTPGQTPGQTAGPAAGPAAGSAGTGSEVPSPMANLPVGATFGSLVHAVLEHADPAAAAHGGDLRSELLEHVEAQLVRWPVDLVPDELADALLLVCDSPLGPLAGDRTLRQIGRGDRMAELDFELPLAGGDRRDHPRTGATLAGLAPLLREHLAPDDPLRPYADTLERSRADQLLHGYLTGSVDAVLRVDGRFVVVDYKTNWLGAPDELLTSTQYQPAQLAAAMTHSTYPLQAVLYAVVLHRFLRWRLAGYDPARHLGGVMYLYLRGMCGPATPVVDGQPCGVFAWQPPVALVEAVSELLDGVPRDSPAGPRVRGASR